MRLERDRVSYNEGTADLGYQKSGWVAMFGEAAAPQGCSSSEASISLAIPSNRRFNEIKHTSHWFVYNFTEEQVMRAGEVSLAMISALRRVLSTICIMDVKRWR